MSHRGQKSRGWVPAAVLLLQLPLLHLQLRPHLLLQVLGLQQRQHPHLLLVLRAAAAGRQYQGCCLLYCLAAGSWTAWFHLLLLYLLLCLQLCLPDWGRRQCCCGCPQAAAVLLMLHRQMALQRCRQPGARCLRHKVQRVSRVSFQQLVLGGPLRCRLVLGCHLLLVLPACCYCLLASRWGLAGGARCWMLLLVGQLSLHSSSAAPPNKTDTIGYVSIKQASACPPTATGCPVPHEPPWS